LLINVYFPYIGTQNRLLVYEQVLQKISLCAEQLSDKTIILGGDFNVDLNKSSPTNESSPTFNLLNQFALYNGLVRCANLFTYLSYNGDT